MEDCDVEAGMEARKGASGAASRETHKDASGKASPFVLAFESTHAAMEAISTLEQGGVPHAVIPTPRAISAGCGMSLRFSPELFDAVRRCLGLPDGAPHATLYRATADGGYTPHDYGA